MNRAILLAVAVIVSPMLWGQGLLKNAGFSDIAEGTKWPTGWECTKGRELYGYVNIDGLASNDSLRYVAEKAGVPCLPVTQSFQCVPNTQYVLLAGLKGDGTTRPYVAIYAQGMKTPAARVNANSEKWQRQRITFNSGGARTFEVQLHGDASMARSAKSVVGMAGFDAIQVYRADQEPKETAPAVPFVAPGPNIALDKPYTLSPRPSYRLCTDADDKIQLTDGTYTVGYFWTQMTTVGYSRAYPAMVTIDLGKIEAIAGVSLSTAAGAAGVTWPETIFVLVSDDGKNWRSLGDIISLSLKHGLPSADKYSTHRFATADLKACGRYVQVMVAQTPYCFMDEIEVYRGKDEWRALPPQGKPVTSAKDFFLETKIVGSIRWRLASDLAAAQTAIREAGLPAPASKTLLAQTDLLAKRIETIPNQIPDQFRTVLPLNDLHADIYAMNAPLLQSRGFNGLSVWQANRWDPLQPTDAPEAPAKITPMRIDLMRNEVRAEAFNLLNATAQAKDVTIAIQGLPEDLSISVRDVLFTDTRTRIPIAAALPEARKNADGAFVSVPAGCSKQVWISIEKPAKPLAGEYQGTVRLTAKGWSQTIPLTVRVADLDFPEQVTMSFGGWDYTNGSAAYYRAPGNVDKLVAMLREYHADTPWATSAVTPKGATFDEQGSLTNPGDLDFTNWDEWVERWE
ncbi:MAG: hypothetical protein HN380_16585, partial [Victivallales bacterium]|nr:hypothetical protein [Victivallales bacterium]